MSTLVTLDLQQNQIERLPYSLVNLCDLGKLSVEKNQLKVRETVRTSMHTLHFRRASGALLLLQLTPRGRGALRAESVE